MDGIVEKLKKARQAMVLHKVYAMTERDVNTINENFKSIERKLDDIVSALEEIGRRG